MIIPDDISAPAAPSADLRMVLKSAAELKNLAPDAITVADPLAFIGCGRSSDVQARIKGASYVASSATRQMAVIGNPTGNSGASGASAARNRCG